MRRMVQPRWLVTHLLVITAAVVMVFLSRWQLRRAHQTHSFQNWAYVVEWLLFAGFTIVAYVRFARDEVAGRNDRIVPQPPRRMPVAAADVPAVTDEEDPELAEYNRYLARLHAQSSQ